MNINPYVSLAKGEMSENPTMLNKFKTERDELQTILNDISSAEQKKVSGISSFCPYIIFVRLDALKSEDYPNGLSDNSVYLEFEVDLIEKKVELLINGSIWLSPYDREHKYKYLAMKSMVKVLTDFGGKKFRKQSFKNMQDLAARMENYYIEVMEAVKKYTDNKYPYKEGTLTEEAA